LDKLFAVSRAGLVRLCAIEPNLAGELCHSSDVGLREPVDPYATDPGGSTPWSKRCSQASVADCGNRSGRGGLPNRPVSYNAQSWNWRARAHASVGYSSWLY